MSQISIILPTYNVEKYIARALDSCIKQSFKDIEIIIVDDFGNDKSIDIAKEYASKDERIKIIHNDKNLGTFASRNIGVLNSNSPYIMFLDPDDYLELNACEECEKYFNSGFDFIWFNLKYDNKLQEKTLDDLFLKYEEYIKYVIIENIPYLWNLCSKLIKKDIYINVLNTIKNPYIKLRMAEDALMYYFIVLNSKNIKTSSKTIYNYMSNNTSATQTKNLYLIKQNINDEKIIISLILDYLKHHALDNTTYIFSKYILYRLYISNIGKKIEFHRKTNYILYKFVYKFLYKNKKLFFKIKCFLLKKNFL
ncbi:glycosyltransferase family 2 protein [Campylobacter volucris]|uniref:Glycosyltransferase family 2 protein n=1 Tax=Campylobacter volucris TaxID=1031542 RepID=A0AAE5YIW3_9BACT|nr:glycosyltransferase family 2 protein [Campylobacter volucris]AJC94520.1 glycosyltransferase, family 2 [Campylobacter volucris LMG 24379]KAB0578168.1 glycosyltransferase family 2 protein [Campylobacter volucris]QBL13128.1 glycosyltransferase family 2 protein [Campylobacter volucris]QEL08737.1 glycosyltransferase, family 2 [Campylobacter volucris]TXK71389.1 glycosyltransferase family 2 protein [Campylobacter volucris]